ncbi:MAG: heme-dependent oxidative N-demethylase family protein [Actinomycetota bacterium]
MPGSLVPKSSDAPRLRVGARPLDPSQWVSARDADWAPTVAMKRALVTERPHEVVACLDGAQEACDEAAAGVLASVGEAPTTETGVDALVDAALRVADDLCLLLPGPGGEPVLSAAVLCSPNRWRLAEKLGGTMAAIHGPVARYGTDLDSPVNAMLARLSVGRPVWRVNWGLSNHPSLFQPEVPPVTPAMDIADMWFRVEWQTLRRLPVTGAVLFTIRTHTERLADFAGRDRAVIHDFADLVAKIPEDVAAYKSIAPYRERVYEWLSSR